MTKSSQSRAERAGDSAAGASFTREDFMALTKARLSMLVITTTLVGYWLGSITVGAGIAWDRLLHTAIGSLFAAGAASVFNQLMEIDLDARMQRTADRPLPAKKIPPATAFVIGWVLAALGVVHLAVKVNSAAAAVAAATIFIYVFIYTPLKRRSTTNTLVGAVSGALPPLIGWFGAGGTMGPEAWFLFGLLFFWQLPHFVAINWMYRDQYEDAGFKMWSNGDETGRRTATFALLFSICLTALMALPAIYGFAKLWAVIAEGLLALFMVWLSLRFLSERTRGAARKLFFYTLLYLPAALAVLIFGWVG